MREQQLNILAERNVRLFIASGPVTSGESTKTRRDALEANVVEWRLYPQLRTVPLFAEFVDLVRFVKAHNINVHGLSALLWVRCLFVATGARLVATCHPSAGRDLQYVRTVARKTTLKAGQRSALNCIHRR
jgi:hypothetical protein